ncbi:hypothetical protein MP228_001238 [Amoeboaphelidium protococcarum]|nr:hypothetical protein MP228_001238 [Amoeboaphelidium protococcarum]
MFKSTLIVAALVQLILQSPVSGHETKSNQQTYQHFETNPMGNLQNYEFVSYSNIMLHPESLRQRLVKRSYTPQSSDQFLLEMDAYNTTFCFLMQPNENLLHPQVKWRSHQKGMSAKSRSQVVENDLTDAKVYKGHVVDAARHSARDVADAQQSYDCSWQSISPDLIEENQNRNWARFVVKDKLFASHSQSQLKSSVASNSDSNLDNLEEDGPVEEKITMQHQIEGAFKYNGEIYTVKSVKTYENVKHVRDKEVPKLHKRHVMHRNAEMVIYKLSDIKQDIAHGSHSWCGHDHLDVNMNGDAQRYYESLKQRVPASLINSPVEELLKNGFKNLRQQSKSIHKRSVVSGCPTAKKILYMGVAADCSYIQRLGGSEQDAKDQILSSFNTVSAIYEETFNIYIGLVNITTFPTCGGDNVDFNQAFSAPYTISKRLSDFSKWRGDLSDPTAGLWHLMSNGSTNPTVGLAWLNRMCQTSQFSQSDSSGNTQYVSGTAVSTPTAIDWMVVAHEIGHNFGAIHDCDNTACSQCNSVSSCASSGNCYPCTSSTCSCDNKFIMAASSSFTTPINKFSLGTQQQVCSKMLVLGTCLQQPGSRTVLNGNVCGNGIKEAGEQCDGAGKDTACCFQNCTLKATAQCDEMNDDCCRNCTIIPQSENKICRESTGECDITEYCSGGASCPSDTYIPDGTTCSNATGFSLSQQQSYDFGSLGCTTGICSNRKSQCVLFGGSSITGECQKFSGQCVMYCDDVISSCIKIANSFREGTPCGDNGVCQDGVCSNPDFIGRILQWYFANQNVAIVLLAIVVIVFMVLFAQCMRKIKADKRIDIIQQARLQEEELARLEKIEREQRRHAKQSRVKQSTTMNDNDRRVSKDAQIEKSNRYSAQSQNSQQAAQSKSQGGASNGSRRPSVITTGQASGKSFAPSRRISENDDDQA